MNDTRIQKFKINSYEVDESAAARLTSIANYLQEIAYNHANELGVGYHELLARKMVWVLSRLHIEMDKYPSWDEILTVETWPRPIERLFANRDFRLSDQDGKQVGRASTQWLVLDSEKHRPVRPFDDLFAFPLRSDSAFSEVPGAINPSEVLEPVYRRKVRYSDLDVVGHVNNVKYIEWSLDALDPALIRQHPVKSMTVNYLQEARREDDVTINASSVRDGKLWVNGNREADGKEVFRAEFRLGN